MKLNKFTNLLVIGLVVCVAASGCKKKPVDVTELPGSKGRESPGRRAQARQLSPARDRGHASTDTTGGTPSNPPDLHEGWIEDAQALKAQTVYFDFDSSAIKASEKPKVAAVADYLKANKGKAVRVEGNCDERGTEEYNRSLGERRALAVREELIRLGIGPTEVDTISYGKDKPVAQGHDEAAWKQNRRDDFIVSKPAGQVGSSTASSRQFASGTGFPSLCRFCFGSQPPAKRSQVPVKRSDMLRRVSVGYPKGIRRGFAGIPGHSQACFSGTRATLPSPSTSLDRTG